MKTFKKTLCIFLAVVMLFFSVNNSYFSPHKMDTVEASSIVIGGAVISIDLIIKVIAALAVAGLSVGVIVEWSDMDMEAVLEDFHSWLQSNTAVLDSLQIDGTSALKEWAASDTWTVIEGGAGGSEPSPSPDNDSDKHGLKTALKIGALVGTGGVSLSTALAPISYVAEYDHYVDSEGNVLESDDPRIKEVAVDSATLAIAQAYMRDKIDTFGTVNAGTDAITQALQSRYVNTGPYYDGTLDIDIDGNYYINVSGSYTYVSEQTITASAISSYRIFAVVNSDYSCVSFFNCYEPESYPTGYTLKVEGTRTYNGKTYSIDSASVGASGSATDGSWAVNVPMFMAGDTEGIKAFVQNSDDSACVNRERANNYIDTNDDYGWASTANISPNDLAAAMPDIAGNLDGRSVSLSGVMAAINALKNKLEEDNPNTGVSDDPAGVVLVPYPNVDDYVDALTSVVTDPDVFPQVDGETDPDPDTGIDDEIDPAPDTETMKDYSGLLGTIIGLLRNILQAIKDLLSWFVIDFSAIKAHLLLALESAPALSGVDDFLALVDYAKTQITDSYEYPVIVIDCPEILKPYWKQEQIVLLDFEDYATYFIWVRTAMAFAILFGFVIVLIKEFKVSFTLN